MDRFATLPIGRKLLVIGLATIAVALLLNNLIFLVSSYVIVRSSVRADVIAQAEIIADNTSAPLAFNDAAAAGATLSAMRVKPSLDLGCLYDVRGALFARYGDPTADDRCPVAPSTDFARSTADGVGVARPVWMADRRVGTLYLHGNLDEVWARLRAQTLAALAGLFLSTVVAVLLMRRLHRTIAGPLSSLSATAADISRRQDYGVRAPKLTSDEIGSLVDAFNEMLADVQRRDAQLSAANLDLSREILERERAENERLELLKRERLANRLKDEFLAALSHELRTPLNAILGWTQILRDTPPDSAKAARGVASIERNARAQARMIEDLLDISRIISGKFHLKMAGTDLATTVEGAIDVIRPTASARSIEIVTSLPPERPAVFADPDRLQQVIWNLLSNAIKFTPKGGAIHIGVSCDEHACTVAVADNGIGIEPGFLPYVFDRFRQSDGSMSREHGGLGLGLAIVHEIVELHGGTVTAASEGRDRGSTFTVRLPRLKAIGHSSRVPAPAVPGRLHGTQVLIVDDDDDTREIAAGVLAAAGATVETVVSSTQALNAIHRERFSAVVCDIGLPGTDGYALLRQIRDTDAARGWFTPAIAVTAYASTEDVARAHATGFHSHVAKPFEIAALVNAVAEAVSARETFRRAPAGRDAHDQ